MKMNFKGLVDLHTLPKTTPLLPLYEAIINSIQSIEDAQISNGKIEIIVERDKQMNLFNQWETDIENIIIVDNGIGFDDENYNSFDTYASEYKIQKGCKGVGRMLWLKAFCSVSIESIFVEEDKKKCRTFLFDANHAVHDMKVKELSSDVLQTTKVRLNGLREQYKGNCPKKLDTIAKNILNHCFTYYVLGKAPKIIVSDERDIIDIDELYKENIGDNIKIDDIDINESMEELKELAKAAGAEVVGSLIQNRQSRDAAFYVGKGKVEEIKAYSDSLGATVVIFNDELSGAHIRNIEEVVGIKVIDRTTLILDIFAQRALSKEGKLQVELAQLNYRLPRLYGMGGQMSRTGAGIGTRGPGEQKLEIDKRNILNKAADIRRELREVKKIRETQRVQRLKSSIPIVALVGYTNAGKSTLLNELIKTHKDYDVEKEVMAKDMLFATLDVTLRKALLPNKKEFLVVDTVGFVSKLPHDLVEAFKATLEEVQYADLILHVIDATNSNYELQKSTTEKVLKELGADTKPTILVYNKIDRLELDIYPKNHDDIVYISAKKGINMDKLIEIIQDNIMKNTYAVTLMLPYERGDIFSRLKNKYNIENFEYVESGITLDVNLEEEDYNIYKEYILEK